MKMELEVEESACGLNLAELGGQILKLEELAEGLSDDGRDSNEVFESVKFHR